MIAALAMLADLPEVLEFPHVGWIVVHLIAIPVVFYIGWRVGRKNPIVKT